MINRRHFIVSASSVAVAGAVSGCGDPDEQEVVRPEGVPVGPFGKESTAEEVTAGIDLSGKTALVTGCNSGLGYETMRVLAMRGAHVIGAARTLEKAETACGSIEGRATPAVCELSELDSIAACGESVRALGMPIDMLILNAGIMALPELRQVRGLEMQFAVNHVGHFVLANQLIEQVKAAPAGRVVVLSSSGHTFAPAAGIEFDNLSGERDYDPWKMYGVSKLANGLFSMQLTKRLADTNATSNAVHPGIIKTNLGRHFPWWQKIAASLIGWTFMKSVEAGAATQCYVATAPALNGISGHYFADCNPLLPDPRMLDEQMAAKLWAVSEELAAGYLV
jgi:NAD(P)-dependent dehydrogenase (short-subunit alcohol dehydrogenase family)